MQKHQYVNGTSSVAHYTAKLNEAITALKNKDLKVDAQANVANLTLSECENMNLILLQLENCMKPTTSWDYFGMHTTYVDVDPGTRQAANQAMSDYNALGVFSRIIELKYGDPTQQRSKAEIEKTVAAEVEAALKAEKEIRDTVVAAVKQEMQGKPQADIDAAIEKRTWEAIRKDTRPMLWNLNFKYELMWQAAIKGENGRDAVKFREALIARVYLFEHHPTVYAYNTNQQYGRLYCALEFEQDSVLNYLYSTCFVGYYDNSDSSTFKSYSDYQNKQRLMAALRPFIYTLVEVDAFTPDPNARSVTVGGYVGCLETTFREYIEAVKEHLKRNEATSKTAAASADAKTAAVGSGGAKTASTETAAAPATATAKSGTALDVKAAGAAPKGTAAAIAAFSATSSADAKSAAAGSAAASGETATAPAKPAEKSAEATAAAAMGMGGK